MSEGHKLEYPRQEVDPQERQISDIVDFVRKYSISGKNMSLAYEIALGVPLDDGQEVNEDIRSLAEIMKKYIDNGLALNKLAELIDAKSKLDLSSEKYHNAVNSMHITDREKEVLNSIVDQKRHGTLVIFDSNGENTLARIGLPVKAVEEMSSDELAMQLLKHLSNFTDMKIAISFSE